MTKHLLPMGELDVDRPLARITHCGVPLLSAALAVALASVSLQAAALTLGRLQVQSALGEPLRAEIDVTEITAAEAEGLRVGIAPLSAFNAAGIPYNNALGDVRVSLQRRTDGRYLIRLNGTRPLNDPFVDLLLETSWNAGRIVRDYTVLLDPPGNRRARATAIAPISPQIGEAPRALTPPVAPSATPLAAQDSGSASQRRQRTTASQTLVDTTTRAGSSEQQVTVKPGDTASRIAASYKPADISLDQMLVAMLRANPDAFIAGNINRIKAGAVLELPAATVASGIEPSNARRTVTAQSRDFSEYRRRLADNAPLSAMTGTDRQSTGRLQANVQDNNATSASPDRLTLSQGATAKASEERLATARQAQENSARAAELSKNISELSKLQAATGSSGVSASGPSTTPSTPAASVPGASAPSTQLPASASPTVTAPAAVPASTATGTAPVPAVAPADGPVAAPKPAAPTPSWRSFLADLTDNSYVLAAGGLIALLFAFLLYRVVGRKKADAGHSVFLESRIPKDSFFGASGGESVDTKDRSHSMVSSLSYSPSQLDSGDVDPVAEADVYLAYGRDLQAEEILREALRTNPERTAIHLKLLEIYAKRRDLRAFEALATDVHKLSGGKGSDWNRVGELGRDLDPGNSLYQYGAPANSAPDATNTAPGIPTTVPAVTRAPVREAAAAPPPAFVPSVAPLDFDLDLSKPYAPAPPPVAPVSASLPPSQHTAEDQPVATRLEQARSLPPVPQQAGFETTERAPLGGTNSDLENDFETANARLHPITRVASLSEEEVTQPATLRAGLPGDSGFIEFDMGSMSGQGPLETQRSQLEGVGEGPHAIKLSLARELHALGDIEGARSLVEEVAAETSGDVKNQAQQLLAELH